MSDVHAGDTITLKHPNGDRIGPRKVVAIPQGAGVVSLLVERVGDVDPTTHDAQYGRYLTRLLAAGWRVTSITPSEGGPDGSR